MYQQAADKNNGKDQQLIDRQQLQQQHRRYLNASLYEIKQRQSFIDAPRQLPKKSYSLAPDMATGWKPKKSNKVNYKNVFPLNFTSNVIDQIVKQLLKKSSKYIITYLGPRKANSFLLHENRNYQNPYPIQKRIQSLMPERPGLYKQQKIQAANLQFDSDFESGNLDVAIKITENQYDLFMRVDSNTRGHTNWFYFEVCNKEWVGQVKFNFCNFRREQSLYQRGMKIFTKLSKENQWTQKGYNIAYERKTLRYRFLYEDDDQTINQSLSTYYTMTFTYNFQNPNEKVYFAYGVPYTYSNLLNLIKQISSNQKLKYQTAWRSLSGLPVPVLQITDFQEPNINKKVVLVTARIHPGESNSSFVCEGFIKSLCSEQAKVQQMLKKFHFYIVPMLNPDGVVAGNYRTSLFGKDLNRTFNQSRKYAFPQSYSLVEYAKKMKKQHKQRFTIYLDLHGHSVKKNIFFYGPDYNIAHAFYNKSRELAKILGNITPMFRYYSCIFRISHQKSTTARATFNRTINIPFTYTLQSSNGAYYDSMQHTEKLFTSKNWVQMGMALVRGLSIWGQNQNFSISRLTRSTSQLVIQNDELGEQEKQIRQKQPPGKQKLSDDQIEQGRSDSEPEDEDLNEQELQLLQKQIEGKIDAPEIESPKKQHKRELSPQKSQRVRQSRNQFDWTNGLRQSYNFANKKQSIRMVSANLSQTKKDRLPPINLQANPLQFFGSGSIKKRITIAEALKNLTSVDINPTYVQRKKRLSISQMVINSKETLSCQQHELVLDKKLSKPDIAQKHKKKR